MLIRPYILIAFACLSAIAIQAQEIETDIDIEAEMEMERTKASYVGLNISPLLTNLIPFNDAQELLNGANTIQYNSINFENNTMTRIAFGFRVQENLFTQNNQYFSLRLSYGKVTAINKKWSINRGIDFHAFTGDVKQPFDSIDGEDGIGLGPYYGIEFHPIPKISIGTDAYLFFGYGGSSGITLNIVPPLNFYANLRFR